jgi:uncharacterized protein (DUF1684 family)
MRDEIEEATMHEPHGVDGEQASRLTLADWRRRVADLYAAVRRSGADDAEAACLRFRRQRDALFARHPDSPVRVQAHLGAFDGLDYYPYDPALRVVGRVVADADPERHELSLPEGTFAFSRIARLEFELAGEAPSLELYWVEGYGGGLFLPFRDATSALETYGGGRYLYDGIKGADLGAARDRVPLDFNYAYNPSCAYDARWVCPLAPASNQLKVAISAGERWFAHG